MAWISSRGIPFVSLTVKNASTVVKAEMVQNNKNVPSKPNSSTKTPNTESKTKQLSPLQVITIEDAMPLTWNEITLG